ncbi:MAG: DUF1684 domain-containing protein [Bacteroidota bacterium]
MLIYDGEISPALQSGTLEWLVIQRQDLFAIRLYDKENEKVDQFTGFPRYPVQSDWHLKARCDSNPEGTTIPVTNVLGQVDRDSSPGTLTFRYDNKLFSVSALEASEERLFLIIGDETNQTETYQADRYMYVDKPGEDGYTTLDFNKLYNPPCAYTPYSTCQLPPRENRLSLAITAGEKRPVDWDGLQL